MRLVQTVVLALIGLGVALALAQQPPVPQTQAMQDMGRQHPYISTVQAVGTSVVTTVYVVKYLRMIEISPSGAETNFIPVRTNIMSVTTTNYLVPP